MQSNDFKNLVLPWYNGLVNLNKDLLTSSFNEIGLDFQSVIVQQLIDQHDRGHIHSISFYQQLSELSSKRFTEEGFISAYSSGINNWNEKLISFIIENYSDFNFFLMGKSNGIHHRHFEEKFQLKYGLRTNNLFEYAQYSHILGMSAQDPRFMKYFWRRTELNPEETTFLISSGQNDEINAALYRIIPIDEFLDNLYPNQHEYKSS